MLIVKILDRTESVSVPVGDEALTVAYRPSVFQDTFMDNELDEISLNAGLAKVICDMDLFDEQGEKLPVTEETFAQYFDRPLKRRIWRAIQEHAFPN